MKLKALISTLIIATFVLVPLSANAEEVEVQPTTTVTEESFVEDYPKITNFAPIKDGVKVSWSAYDGASKYRLYYWNGTMWKVIGTTTNLNLTHNGLTNETTYIYTVRALDSNGNNISDYNHEGYANTYIAQPVISSISNTANGVEIKWNKSDFADSYRIYRKTKNSGWTYIG
ncbi:MAG: fibronectin type III domain-containing protein, partial [Ruminococcus sp.]|nr:fibronectin type III domain-containing protein [Ruminococcus sp.]